VSGGLLRDSVAVERLADYVKLRFSFWELDLPRHWVEESEQASALLDRRASAAEISGRNRELDALVRLLTTQGCLTYPDDRPTYALREVCELYRSLCSTWYGIYYRHPLWARLREGALSRNALVAWLIHNYHLSRSAGMSASRCATRCDREDIKAVFRQSAVEEYPHCEEFYFVRHSHLSIPDSEVKQCLHLPSSLAFDQQMLRIAEEDWLGHVLVGLFQESTARFLDSCRDFYRAVEAQYGLNGFFKNWENHIALDLEYGHAGAFAQVLDSDELVSRDHLDFALRHAYVTFAFLLSALGDLLDEERPNDSVSLRMPRKAAKACSIRSLAEEGQADARLIPVLASAMDREFFSQDFTESLFRALSYCGGHDEAVLVGRLAELAAKNVPRIRRYRQPDSIWAMATANLCREAATSPASFAGLTLSLASYPDSETFLPIPASALDPLRAWTSALGADGESRLPDLIDYAHTFVARWRTQTDAVVPGNLFRM
jgi:hypothetical protein